MDPTFWPNGIVSLIYDIWLYETCIYTLSLHLPKPNSFFEERKAAVFLIIIIIKLILLKIRVRTIKFQIYEWQPPLRTAPLPVALSQTRHCQWRVCLQNTHMLIYLCLWEFIGIKRVTTSGALPFVYLKFYSCHSYF
jgi:hypothetical protein